MRERQDPEVEFEELVSTVSHDFRAPLRAIGGFAHTVLEDEGERLSDDSRRMLEGIADQASRLSAEIQGLVAYARLARAPRCSTPVDMEALVRRVVAEFSRENARAVFEVESLPGARGDPGQFEMVWRLLLDNAVKFSGRTPEPRVTVGHKAGAEGPHYFVRDNGVGFDPRHGDRLFGALRKLHHPSDFPGIGLGLAMVRRIVESHGGRVGAQARPGMGAEFRFSFARDVEN